LEIVSSDLSFSFGATELGPAGILKWWVCKRVKQWNSNFEFARTDYEL
jgi:hypothetical protein